ncbi:LysR family transcriptional regulator [Oceanicola sp. 22II-s10i]|uniref:LysR family transcriptional regulator n=1 Tax=Oceanicola sp. 22II-s10i TaxID=1317116 RepID=UPI000B524C11|nr:LysR family transcriptional regulator [Oceanicola sp. 22II-s10i]OWU86163.1 LysR family transcriptional regulator [Oceanicola sp. 22II-s10i]
MTSPLARIDWTLIEAFLAVAETGSLSAAARRIGASQPTLGRHIQRLETETGQSLFARHPRGFELTEAGQAILPAARRMQQAMADIALTAAGRDSALSGTVRITASEVVSHHILPGIIARIRQAAPDIQIELDARDTTGNLTFREADIAVRMYRPEQLDIVTRHLGDIETGCFAARSYIDRHGRPTGPDDLMTHALIGYDRTELMLRAMRDIGWPVSRTDFATRCDNQVTYWELVRAGCGIGFFQAQIGRADPAVEEIQLGLPLPGLPVWLAAHEAVRRTPRIDLVWTHLAEGLLPHLMRPGQTAVS